MSRLRRIRCTAHRVLKQIRVHLRTSVSERMKDKIDDSAYSLSFLLVIIITFGKGVYYFLSLRYYCNIMSALHLVKYVGRSWDCVVRWTATLLVNFWTRKQALLLLCHYCINEMILSRSCFERTVYFKMLGNTRNRRRLLNNCTKE